MENATIAGAVFVIMYIFIISEKIQRTVVAMLGAIIMLLAGVMSEETALHHIDFNTLGLLIGMMLLVAVTSQTGLFNYIAIWVAKKAQARPLPILIYLGLLTAVCSAFLDNVTTVLLVVPVTISITEKLQVDPLPYLLVQILASNIGGTATLIGDPPNIMIGSAVGLSFMDFIENLAAIAVINLLVVVGILAAFYRKQLVTTDALRLDLLKLDEKKELKNKRLLGKCLLILALTILGFFLHQSLHVQSSLVALTGAFVLLLITQRDGLIFEDIMGKVEWPTLFFFIGLFIAVGGLIETGIIRNIAERGIALTGGDVTQTALLVLWLSAIVSAFLDNIPFVATMIPLIQEMGHMGVSNLESLWWSLALGACLGGNGTIVGASANLIVAALAAANGRPISFMSYMKIGFPTMLLTILLATLYIYWRYLM